jgi:hypothetical protein
MTRCNGAAPFPPPAAALALDAIAEATGGVPVGDDAAGAGASTARAIPEVDGGVAIAHGDSGAARE